MIHWTSRSGVWSPRVALPEERYNFSCSIGSGGRVRNASKGYYALSFGMKQGIYEAPGDCGKRGKNRILKAFERNGTVKCRLQASNLYSERSAWSVASDQGYSRTGHRKHAGTKRVGCILNRSRDTKRIECFNFEKNNKLMVIVIGYRSLN